MRIERTATAWDVLVKRATLFNMAQEDITAQVLGCSVPQYIPVVWWGSIVGGYKTRDIGTDLHKPAITLGELDALQRFEGESWGMFANVLSIMLRIPVVKVRTLQFTSAYRYFLAIVEQLAEVAKAFDSLSLPPELKLPEDGNKYVTLQSRGIADLVAEYVAEHPQYTHAQAYGLPWIVVFRDLQHRWAENCNKRKQIIDERNKAKQRAKK